MDDKVKKYHVRNTHVRKGLIIGFTLVLTVGCLKLSPLKYTSCVGVNHFACNTFKFNVLKSFYSVLKVKEIMLGAIRTMACEDQHID